MQKKYKKNMNSNFELADASERLSVFLEIQQIYAKINVAVFNILLSLVLFFFIGIAYFDLNKRDQNKLERLLIWLFVFSIILALRTILTPFIISKLKKMSKDFNNFMTIDYKDEKLSQKKIKEAEENFQNSKIYYGIENFYVADQPLKILAIGLIYYLKTKFVDLDFQLVGSLSDALLIPPFLMNLFLIMIFFPYRSYWEKKKVKITLDNIIKQIKNQKSLKKRSEFILEKETVNTLFDFFRSYFAMSLIDYFNPPIMIKTPLENMEYGRLSGPHFYFILSFLSKKHIPILDNFATDDTGNCIGIVNASAWTHVKTTEEMTKNFLKDLEFINQKLQELQKKINKFRRFFKFDLLHCFSEVDDLSKLFKVRVDDRLKGYFKEDIDDEHCISSEKFLNLDTSKIQALASQNKIKEEGDFEEKKSQSIFSERNIAAWYFRTSVSSNENKEKKEKIKTRGSSDPKREKKEEAKAEVQIEWNGKRYICDELKDNFNIKFIKLHTSEKPMVGIFRITESMLDGDFGLFEKFKKIFDKFEFVGGRHGDCIKFIAPSLQKEIKSKKFKDKLFDNYEIPCQLHQAKNERVLSLDYGDKINAKILGESYSDIKIYDFCVFDKEHHSNKYANVNQESLEEYLENFCMVEKIESQNKSIRTMRK